MIMNARHRIIGLTFSLLFFLAAGVLRAAPPGHPSVPPRPEAQGASSNYVGDEVCITCHEDQVKRFKNTVMGKAFANPRPGKDKWGCETCHGPGKTHVEAGGGKDTIPLRFGRD